MVLIFLLFGYRKWFEYEAQVLIPSFRTARLVAAKSGYSSPILTQQALAAGVTELLGRRRQAFCRLRFSRDAGQ